MALSMAACISLWLEAQRLPRPLRLYEVAGQTMFPIVATSGGILFERFVSYIFEKFPEGAVDLGLSGLGEGANGRWYAITFDGRQTEESVAKKVSEAVKALGYDPR